MISKRLAQVAAGAAALFMLAGGPAMAKKVKVVPGDPPVMVDIPASWEVSEIKRGIEAKTADEEVLVWFENYKPNQLERIIAEHNDYFKEQGVTITGTAKATAKDFPTYGMKVSEYPATYEGGPTIVRYLSVVPKDEEKRHLLVSYWASPEGDKDYDDEVNKIMDSLRASVEAQ